MNQAERFNGSVDLLANAMRTVVSEAVLEGIKPVREDMRAMEGRLRKEIETGLRNTNESFQAQLAEHREEVAKEVKSALRTTNQNVQAQLAEHRKEVAAQLAKNRKDVVKDFRRELARH